MVSGARTTITATTLPGNNGRLINDTLLPTNAVITKVGGVGNEFTVNGKQYNAVPKSEYTESGVWRTEISGKTVSYGRYNANEEFLNVMQISENDSNLTPLNAILISSVSGYNSVKIKDRIVYLKKTETLNSSAVTLAETDKEYMQIIDGLTEGVWTIKNSAGTVIATENVYAGHNTLSFTAPAGAYTLTRINSSNTESKDYSIFARKRTEDSAPVDIKINNIYETFHTGTPYVSGETIYLPAEEFSEKLGKTYSYSGNVLKIGGKTVSSTYTQTVNGILYVAPVKAASAIGISTEWSAHLNILFVK